MEIEIWKDVIGYEGLYQISNLGNVKSTSWTKERILKPYVTRNGYKAVIFSKKQVRANTPVHILVAVAFLGHIRCGHDLVINHIDGNKLNNNSTNLEIVTSRDNVEKYHKTKRDSYLSKYIGVRRSKINNKWQARINIKKRRYSLGYYNTEIEASNAYQNKLKEMIGL